MVTSLDAIIRVRRRARAGRRSGSSRRRASWTTRSTSGSCPSAATTSSSSSSASSRSSPSSRSCSGGKQILKAVDRHEEHHVPELHHPGRHRSSSVCKISGSAGGRAFSLTWCVEEARREGLPRR
uniref:Uncharacterized protein n=1 Tax=Arundo donax TaxID=35708 RepID=A0A0A9CS36_ARUDO